MGEKSSLALNLSCTVRRGRGWRDATWIPQIGKQRPHSLAWISWNVCPQPQNRTPRLWEVQAHWEVVWVLRLTAPAETGLHMPWSTGHLMKESARSSQCSAIEASQLRSQPSRGSESWHRLLNCAPSRFLIPRIVKHCKIAGILYPLWRGFCNSNKSLGVFLGGSLVKNPPASTGDAGSIPGSGRSPGEGNSNPLQYSCLENSTDRGAWWATVQGLQRLRHDSVTNTHTMISNVY